jgi:hypothetical protein
MVSTTIGCGARNRESFGVAEGVDRILHRPSTAQIRSRCVLIDAA